MRSEEDCGRKPGIEELPARAHVCDADADAEQALSDCRSAVARKAGMKRGEPPLHAAEAH